MALFELTQNDVNDIANLISGPTLTIVARDAQRVAYLQLLLKNLQPSAELAKVTAKNIELESQIRAALSTRDAALLEAGIAKRRIDELESAAAQVS